MSLSRRRFLAHSSLLAAASALACKGSEAPAFHRSSQRRVTELVTGVPTRDGAGVSLTRIIGSRALPRLDPFLMLDRFHSDDPGAYIAGFPDHPHRGFETVTVMRHGRMRHRDSRGNAGLILGSGAQWMTAGRGIVHSEMPEQDRGLMSGFQLWINLPAKEKLCPQHYQDLQPAHLAEGRLGSAGSHVRLISGLHDGLVGPVRERPTQPLLLTAALEDDRPLELHTPEGHNAFVFVSEGSVSVGPDGQGTEVPAGRLAVLGAGTRLTLRATRERSEVLVAAAKPLREPVVQWGPFVMNTEQEIRQAIADYQAGVLDKA